MMTPSTNLSHDNIMLAYNIMLSRNWIISVIRGGVLLTINVGSFSWAQIFLIFEIPGIAANCHESMCGCSAS